MKLKIRVALMVLLTCLVLSPAASALPSEAFAFLRETTSLISSNPSHLLAHSIDRLLRIAQLKAHD